MLLDESAREHDNVTGVTFKEASDIMDRRRYLIKQQEGKGFASKESCASFAHDNHMDIMVYMKSLGTYRSVNHTGDTITHAEWKRAYRDVLYYSYITDDGDVKYANYTADSYSAFDDARTYGEQSDGIRKPLYYRDYFVPTGYYNEETGKFNVAKPFTTFAKETGADTSAIHTLLRHLAGECYPHLLHWLRHKLIYPTTKTEVIPIFVGEQGTGKSTFGLSICTALFGKDNVIVTDQFDSTARFNADNADALIVCIEEKTQEDNRNSSSSLKARATATTVRKEHKGVDPFYQESYTDFMMSTNEFVPIKFEGRGNQRRFMVMEVDPTFTRDESTLAEEVYTKLYGINGRKERVGVPLTEDKETIEQFKYDLLTGKNIGNANFREFPKTAAYQRCFSIPRTSEAVEIETIIKSLAPFVKASLDKRADVDRITIIEENGEKQDLYLDSVLHDIGAMQYVTSKGSRPDRVALCKSVAFSDFSGKPYSPSIVDRTLLDMRKWLRETHNLVLMSDASPPSNGFKGIVTRAKNSPAAWFKLDEEDLSIMEETLPIPTKPIIVKEERIGQRMRYNGQFVFDPDGEFETLNEILPEHTAQCYDCYEKGRISISQCKTCKHNRRKETAAYMDTFLLESDSVSKSIEALEEHVAQALGPDASVNAEEFYAGRLKVQDSEARRLFSTGAVARIVYSGSKSIHLLVRVKDSPTTLEERAWLDAYLKSTLSDRLVFDASTKDPTRLTRSPCTKERTTTYKDYKFKIVGQQRLLEENWSHLYDKDWRGIYEAWKAMPPTAYEERGRMLPTKPIYQEAVKDILSGVYFTDKRWTGIRQETFFPAYRLLRAMGYGHDELWKELYSQIDHYRKVNEQDYWRTRKTSNIIKSIDEEFDDE